MVAEALVTQCHHTHVVDVLRSPFHRQSVRLSSRRAVGPLPRKPRSQPHQPHPAGSRPHNPAGTEGCGNLRRGWAAVSRTTLPSSHGGQYDASDTQCWPVRNRVQKSARHRCSCTPGSSHSSEAAHPTTSTYLSALDDEGQATSKVVRSEGGPGSRRNVATNSWRTAGAKASQTRPSHPLNIPAPPLKMKT